MKKAIIAEVYPGSLADNLGIKPGDKILKINNYIPEDLIDFQYLWADEYIELLIEKKNEETVVYEIEKEIDDELGIKFEKAVFDKVRNCHNKCIFCFVDQMSPAMRKSLYVKDDDYRLSFLQGNFITLTNLSERDIDRIKRLNLSPLYVSVHTTDPDLRIKMMGNPKANKIMDLLKNLIKAGINIHTQIVLCPGINDGIFLEKTINDLSSLWPGVLSIAIVPVGVTKFRKNIENFPEITKEYAQELIKKISQKQKYFREKYGNTLVFLSDEFYIKGNKMFPPALDYEDFPQIENGVGLCRMFIDEYQRIKIKLPKKVNYKKYTIVTSVLGESVLKPIINELSSIEGLKLELLTVRNHFFGPRVTVAGLLTGKDLLIALKDIKPGSNVIIPDIMLKEMDNVFLDGLTPKEVAEKLNINLIPVASNFKGLVNQILN